MDSFVTAGMLLLGLCTKGQENHGSVRIIVPPGRTEFFYIPLKSRESVSLGLLEEKDRFVYWLVANRPHYESTKFTNNIKKYNNSTECNKIFVGTASEATWRQ